MTLKTYQASTMSEALAEVKRDLGRDAVILHTRSFRKGGLLGWIGGKNMWEVTAAPNINVVRRMGGGRYISEDRPVATADAPSELAVQEAPAAADIPAADVAESDAACEALLEQTAPEAPAGGDSLGRQMGEIRSMVERLLTCHTATAESDLPEELRNIRQELLRQDVEEEQAWELISQLRMNLTGREITDVQHARQRMTELIAARIATVGSAGEAATAESSQRRVMAFIGPTGVGKTTTIAKLAANYKLRQNKRVGLITIDTYRIAAIDQLRAYAEIIEVPLQAVLTPGELQQAVGAMADKDVVLVDTAGRSQNNTLRLNQLRSFLSACGAQEVHLVLSATANRKSMRSTLERFSPLGVNRIILTKLDEAETFGAILTAAGAGRALLSYVTTGQDVPDDIAAADPHRLARSIMEGNMQPCR